MNSENFNTSNSQVSDVPSNNLKVPQSGWLNTLAETGLPRRGSYGFNENYVSDSAPPFCLLEEDSGFSPSNKSTNTSLAKRHFPGINTQTTNRPFFEIQHPIYSQDLPSPSENLLFACLENQKSSSVNFDLGDDDCCKSSEDSPCEEDVQSNLKLKSSTFIETSSLTDKIAECIPMDHFPVATVESLEELERLNEQKFYSKESGKVIKLFHCETNEPSPNMDGDLPAGASNTQPDTNIDKEEQQSHKLAALLFSQPFAQNWFFKKSDAGSDSSQTSRMKEVNIWAPHNL